MSGNYAISPYGEAALLVRFEQAIDPGINRRAHTLAERIRHARRSGRAWHAPVPSYASVLAPFDALRWSMPEAERALAGLLASPGPDATADDVAALPPLELRVRYGAADGPDLDDVAARTGLTRDEVVALHSGRVYRAYVLGFAPGFAYLGELPEALELPRRATPRQRVAPGSVAIAGRQTAVYPLPTPGGWHLIGRTDAMLWQIERDRPALIEPGREVRFVPE